MKDQVDFAKLSVHEGPEKSPGYLLWHISTSWRRSIEEALNPIGLTHPQFVVLATLGWLTRTGDRVTQKEVGKMANLDPNTTSQIVKGLEKKGLLKREPSLDGRAKNPFLTELGKEILRKALPIVEAEDQHFFRNLNNDEMRVMLEIFNKLTKSI